MSDDVPDAPGPAAPPMAGVEVDLELLPLPALLSRDGMVVSTNRAYREMVERSEAELHGRTSLEVIQRTVHPADLLMFEALAKSGEVPGSGHRWCRIVTRSGAERPVRVEWRIGRVPTDIFTYLVEAAAEAYGQTVADTLARTAGRLGRAATEAEVLSRAADCLAEQGFTVTVLLIDPDSPQLRYGPQRLGTGVRVPPARDSAWASQPPPRALLEQINPRFSARRAAYYQDGVRLVQEAYPEPIAAELARRLPSSRMVQVPLFVDDQPYGAVVVTGEALNPQLTTALELFCELVGQALANLRLRRDKVAHERLAALGEAAAVMAHEVRNPVGAILNAVALVRRVAPGSDVHDQMVTVIAEEAARLEHLVTQLLDVGRPLAPRPRRVALAELVDATLELLVTRRESGAERFHFRAPTTPLLVEVDPDLAQLALLNVLRNALQSTSTPEPVRVSLEESGARVAVVIEDRGPGIPEEVLGRLGEPFVTTRASGTGIGLAVVRRILQASRGQLQLGAAAGGGARVELSFPAYPAVAG